ncbi:SpoVT-AbrB domain-containing protein [Deinococcus saxicola]|uniref:hypothetical protein n=1 Tax=Deinococcus saxicola TaxID=249406 RepID=UPI0039F014D1
MTVTEREMTVTITDDGNLKLPQEALDALGTRQVQLRLTEGQMIVRPRTMYLHEIENVEERMQAFDQFIAGIARETGVKWPVDYDIRDDIYD